MVFNVLLFISVFIVAAVMLQNIHHHFSCLDVERLQENERVCEIGSYFYVLVIL